MKPPSEEQSPSLSQEQQKRKRLPSMMRPIFIGAALMFFVIALVVWIGNIWGKWDQVMSAIFTASGVIFAFLALPFLYAKKEEVAVIQPPPANTPPVTIAITNSFSSNQPPEGALEPAPDTKKQPKTDVSSVIADADLPSDNRRKGQGGANGVVGSNATITMAVSQPDVLFIPNGPLTHPSNFGGRLRERSTLLERTRAGASTSIVGPRRIGKTWLVDLLRLVAPQELGNSYRIGYMDTTLPSSETITQFTTAALRQLDFSIGGPHLGLIRLESAVNKLKAGGETPVLCIDEFEGFSDVPEFDWQFLGHLRAIAQLGLVLVIVSKQPLRDMAKGQTKTSPFFNIFEQLALGPFTEKEATEFLHSKGKLAGFTESEMAGTLNCALKYIKEGERGVDPLRLQRACVMLLEDKRQAVAGGSGEDWCASSDYWQRFDFRLKEAMQ